MTDIWVPGYQKIILGLTGGVFDETSHPKGCLHTTEGKSLSGAEAAYRDYPPHLGYNPITRQKHQYVPLNRHSYALRGSESDDEYIIQVEIVGYAAESHNWSDYIYQRLADDVVKPLEDLIGIPRTFLRFYGEDDGIVLASKDSPIRLSPAELRSYSGWLGHQHIPDPDIHWDPGKLLISKCFKYLGSKEVEDDMFSDKDREMLKHLFEIYRKGEGGKWGQGEMNSYIMKMYRGESPGFSKLMDKIDTLITEDQS